MVRNAGHLVPYDQPLWAYDMIRRFVEDKSFDGSYIWEHPLQDPLTAEGPSKEIIPEKGALAIRLVFFFSVLVFVLCSAYVLSTMRKPKHHGFALVDSDPSDA